MEKETTNLEALEYNTQRDELIFREYGRNIQNLVRHLKTIEDIDERTRAAETLINLMKQLNPSVKENSDNIHRIWDHLYIMADEEIEFNNEFKPKTKEERSQKPAHIGYTDVPVKYRHYGRNVELLIEKACEIKDEDELKQAVAEIGKLMKTFYLTWNRDNVEDETILKDIKRISNGKIDISLEEAEEEDLLELDARERKRSKHIKDANAKHRQHDKNNNRRKKRPTQNNTANNNSNAMSNSGGQKKNRRRNKRR